MEKTREILEKLLRSEITLEAAESELKANRVEMIDEFVCIDFQRDMRTGIPEMVYGENKKSRDIALIAMRQSEKSKYSIITRVDQERVPEIKEHIEEGFEFEYNEFNSL